MVEVIVTFRDAVFSALMAWGGLSAEPDTPIKDRELPGNGKPAIEKTTTPASHTAEPRVY